MTEPEKRFATSDDAIDFVLKHNLSEADAEVIFQECDFDADEALRVVEQSRKAKKEKAERDARSAALGRQVSKPDHAEALYRAIAKAKEAKADPPFSAETQPGRAPQPERAEPTDTPEARLKRSGLAKLREQAKAEADGADVTEVIDKAETKRAFRQKMIAELADVFRDAPSLQYDTQKELVARALGVSEWDVHRAVQAFIKKEKKAEDPELTQAQKAVAITHDDGYRVWASGRDPYVSVIVDGHWENYAVDSSDFNDILINEYSKRHWIEVDDKRYEAVLGANALNDAKAMIRAKARASKEKVVTALRVGGPEEVKEVWLDLGRSDWTLVRVTAEGWKLFREGAPGVAFIRRRDMGELPIPERGGDIRELGRFIHVQKGELVLGVGAQLSVLFPMGEYPITMWTGVSGAAKTSGSRVFQLLCDPNTKPGPFPKSEDDLMITVHDAWLSCFDNISKIDDQMSDALCRISTGAGYKKRKLRSDGDTFRLEVLRPLSLNGIPDDLANRTDLAKRAIVFELKEFEDGEQIGQDEFWRGFREAQPKILGALLDGVVGALADSGKIDLSKHKDIRMMDFARWAEAGCRRLGFVENEFLDALILNQSRAMRIAFDQDPVAQAIALLIKRRKDGVWRGNIEPLHAALENVAPAAILRSKRWPTDAVWLGRALRRSVGVLRKHCGIRIAFEQNLRKTNEGENHGIEIFRSA